MTLYLDLDGPLLDVADRYHAVYGSIVRRFGATPIDRERYWGLKRRRRRDKEICAVLHPEIDGEEYDALFRERIESPGFLASDRLVPGALETLAALRRRHRLVLATLRRRGGAMRDQVRALGLEPMLDGVLQREGNDGSWKHKTRMILDDAAERRPAGLDDPSRALVGDTEGDLRAARAAGALAVAVCNGLRGREELAREAPEGLIETIRDLPAFLGGWVEAAADHITNPV